jgi:hypothetical protein
MKKILTSLALAVGLFAMAPAADLALKSANVEVTIVSQAFACGNCDGLTGEQRKRAQRVWDSLTDAQKKAAWRKSRTPVCPQGTVYRRFKDDGSSVQRPIVFSRTEGLYIPDSSSCPKCKRWAEKNGYGGRQNTTRALPANSTGACLPPGAKARWCDMDRTEGTRAFAN